MIVCVLSDTHLDGDLAAHLPDAALRAIEEADLVLHAGDLTSLAVYQELASMAPTKAVLGNNDRELVGLLPETLELELEGVRVAMIHDSGARLGRESRMARRFPGAHLVVFGHSHLPLDQPGLGDQLLFNPGSPTLKRQAPHFGVGRLVIEAGRLLEHRVISF